jgi:putative phosphoribosyl transferase
VIVTEPLIHREDVCIGPNRLNGILAVPAEATGIVIFAHGSGSGRHSPRNNHVAAALNRAGLATLLLDLLTPDEELKRVNVFDVRLLAGRLSEATDWVAAQPQLHRLRIGYFGASTGAGAALVAAALADGRIGAIVSLGGRPDIAGHFLTKVRAPTLLLVGSLDHDVIGLNRDAYELMQCKKRMVIVPGAGHLFEEPGTLDQVIRFSIAWFDDHLTGEGG